jgi:hypothetical protein
MIVSICIAQKSVVKEHGIYVKTPLHGFKFNVQIHPVKMNLGEQQHKERNIVQ